LSELVYHPAFQSHIRMDRGVLPDDPDDAVAVTIERMAALVREDADAPALRKLAADLRGADCRATLQNVFNWIRGAVRFSQDVELAAPLGSRQVVEVLIRPVDLIAMPAPGRGDCDDFSMLGAAILSALRYPVRFVTVAADGSAPDRYSHVYLRVWCAGRWVPFDSSHGPFVGWEVPDRFQKLQEWGLDGMPVVSVGSSDLSGVGLGFELPMVGDSSSGGAWWSGALQTGLDILKARYAVPPVGTTIQTQQGFYTRQDPSAPGVSPYGFGAQVGVTPGAGFGGISPLLLIGGLVALVLVMKGNK
jgi:transglutaminase-like putative cysteine protease